MKAKRSAIRQTMMWIRGESPVVFNVPHDHHFVIIQEHGMTANCLRPRLQQVRLLPLRIV